MVAGPVRHDGNIVERQRWVTALVLLLCGISVIALRVVPAYSQPDDPPTLADIVILTEDNNYVGPGCDKFSVYDLSTKSIVHGGSPDDGYVSPGRAAGNVDLTVILAVQANRPLVRDPAFLTRFERPSVTSSAWATSIITGADFTEQGDVALMGDGDTFFVSEGDNHITRVDLTDAFVTKYRLSDVRNGRIGAELARVRISQPASRIIPTHDDLRIHVLESTPRNVPRHSATVRTFDAATLAEVLPPIDIVPVSEQGFGNGSAHMTLSPDGRYLVTNVRRSLDDSRAASSRQLNVIDTRMRISRVVDIARNRDELQTIAGVQYNYGWLNQGLLAVHGWNSVSVYAQSSDGNFELRGRTQIPPLETELQPLAAPVGKIAWSAPGDRLIAASSASDPAADFVVVSVTDEGRRLAVEAFIDACDSPEIRNSRPLEIITANGMPRPQAPPSPTPSPSPAPPTATPAPACLCRTVERGVPAAVIANALANPATVYGWQQPLNPNLRPGPNNPLRTCLSLRNPNLRYDAEFNSVTWQAGCP